MSVERVIPVPSMLKPIIRQELEYQLSMLRANMTVGQCDALAKAVADVVIMRATFSPESLKAPTDPQIDLLNRKLNVMMAAMEMQSEKVKQYENLYGPLPKRA